MGRKKSKKDTPTVINLNPWDRQISETDVSFEAFVIYRDLGPGRSLEIVREKLGKSATLIERWSSKHDWGGRVAQWDTFLDQQKQSRILFNLDQTVDRMMTISGALMALGAQRLNTVEPEKLPITVAARLIQIGAKIQESAFRISQTGLDEETENVLETAVLILPQKNPKR